MQASKRVSQIVGQLSAAAPSPIASAATAGLALTESKTAGSGGKSGKESGPACGYTVSEHGLAVLTLNNPPVNSYAPKVYDAFSAALKRAYSDAAVKAIIITGAGSFFMAGADIPHLTSIAASGNGDASKQFLGSGHKMLAEMEAQSKPVVAALNGPAFGGGLEVAMACHARVSSAKAAFGLPELKLGLFPALGGTQRLPRLIGLQPAVQAILTSQTVPAPAALQIGLVDEVVKDPKQLLQAAGKYALELAAGKKKIRRSLELSEKLGSKEDGERFIENTRAETKKKQSHLPHVFAMLDAVKEGLVNGGKAGIQAEIDLFAQIIVTPTARALTSFFLAQRETSKIPGLGDVKPRALKRVAVIGGGTMGSGICIVYLMKGYQVILKEINEQLLAAGVERICQTVSDFLKKRKLPAMGIEQVLRGLIPQTTYDGFDKCDLVIEAVIENIPLKQKIFAELEKVCSKQCILATNTSTIDIDAVGKLTKAQDRILGLHFFSPAHVMPLLEIVRTTSTSAQTIATTVAMAKGVGKTPVVVGNCVGFTANRMFFPYGQAAGLLVDAGVDPYAIDKAILAWGNPMGPFQMSDLSGLDVGVSVSGLMASAYGDRSYLSTLSQKLVKAGRLGQKSATGGYYVNRKPDPKGLAPFVAAARADAKLPANLGAGLGAKEIVEIALFPVVNEAYRIVAEGHVIRESDVDVVSIFGYGFPAWRGGVLSWAKETGLRYVRDRLKYYSETLGADNEKIRAFFAPSARLQQAANMS